MSCCLVTMKNSIRFSVKFTLGLLYKVNLVLILLTVKSRTKLAMKKKLLLKQIFTYFNRYILSYGLYKEYVWILFKVFFLIIMVVIIYMVNIFTTRENRVLSFNSSIQTTYRRVACAP